MATNETNNTPAIIPPAPLPGDPAIKRTVVEVRPDDQPLQVFYPEHGWGDVLALCPEEKGQHARVLVRWLDSPFFVPECPDWFVLSPERCERCEWRPVSAFLALYGRADVLLRKS